MIHESRTHLRVRYGETDQMGYCYYGNYAQFFEVGRVEALRELGMSYKSLEETGVLLPVRSFSVEYFRPAKYDDVLEIVTQVVKIDGTRIHFDYQLYNEKKELLAKATTALVFVGKANMKPIAPPAEFLNILNKSADV